MADRTYRADVKESQLYQRWNNTTLICYRRKMICKGCPNEWACNMSKDWCNPYGIKRQVKFATLATIMNIGIPKGEE
jgi:hypothetical protein